jgi:hypothetical protein
MEDDLKGEAQKNKDLGRPLIPEIQWMDLDHPFMPKVQCPSSHCSKIDPAMEEMVCVKPVMIIQQRKSAA